MVAPLRVLLVLVARPRKAQTESRVKAEGHRGNLGSRYGSGRRLDRPGTGSAAACDRKKRQLDS